MGSWVKFNAILYVDLSGMVEKERSDHDYIYYSRFIKADVDKFKKKVFNYLDKLFEKHFHNGIFNLDTGCNCTWMDDNTERVDFDWKNDESGYSGTCVIPYSEYTQVNVQDYSSGIIVLNIWDRHGQVYNAHRFINELKKYFKRQKIHLDTWRSTYVLSDDWCPYVYTWYRDKEYKNLKDGAEEYVDKWEKDEDGYYGNHPENAIKEDK